MAAPMNAEAQFATFPDTAELANMAAQFVPTPLAVDTSCLSAGDRDALARLIHAGRIINAIFRQQSWSAGDSLLQQLRRDKTPLGEARLRLSISTRDRGLTSMRIAHSSRAFPIASRPAPTSIRPT